MTPLSALLLLRARNVRVSGKEAMVMASDTTSVCSLLDVILFKMERKTLSREIKAIVAEYDGAWAGSLKRNKLNNEKSVPIIKFQFVNH